jgi:transposase
MTEKLTITSERVDDIPSLLAHMKKMELQVLLDKHFPTRGNWLGLSLGWVTVIWLTHIVSMGDHRLIIERAFVRLKGKNLSLTPMYLEKDEHATGLIRLLSIGLRVLTLMEFVVRSRLSEQKATLQGLYAGNAKKRNGPTHCRDPPGGLQRYHPYRHSLR